MKTTGRLFIIAGIILLSLGTTACAQDKKDETKVTHTKTMKEVQGEISSVTKRSISIIYSRDEASGEENEILIPLDKKNIQLEHIRNLSELAVGDIVRVEFEEDNIQGRGKYKLNFQAKLISYVKKGQPRKSTAGEPEAAAAQSVLDSGQ